MNIELDAIEARVIGSLMEKAMITPEQYPLSLNALINACNQKSSREPVMALSDGDVGDAVERLQKRYLLREKSGFGGRVAKYHYRLYNDEIGDFRFSPAERAVICLLLLRGPQTPGELRSRAGRMHAFADVDQVEATLKALAGYPQGPFVVQLARQPGRREARYAELFTRTSASLAAKAPAPGGASRESAAVPAGAATAAAHRTVEDADRLTRLEQRVAALEAALAELQRGRRV